MTTYNKSDRVRCIGTDKRVNGLTARVVQIVKSRGVVTIEFDEPQGWCGWYDARIEAIEPLTTLTTPNFTPRVRENTDAANTYTSACSGLGDVL